MQRAERGWEKLNNAGTKLRLETSLSRLFKEIFNLFKVVNHESPIFNIIFCSRLLLLFFKDLKSNL